MAVHELRYIGKGFIRWSGAPTYVVTFDWRRDGERLAKVEATMLYEDFIRGFDEESRFWTAVAVEAGHAWEDDIRHGDTRNAWAIDPWPVFVEAQAAARRAQSDEDLPVLSPGALVYGVEA